MNYGNPNAYWNDVSLNYTNRGIAEYAANPVPIPAVDWLLGSGLVGLVAVRRKFNK